MLPLMVNVLPPSTSGAPSAPVSPQTIPSTFLSDASAAARQQLPSAVNAVGEVVAYSTNVPQLPKPPTRTSSTSFVAQFIGQSPGLTKEELSVFAVAEHAGEGGAEGESASQSGPQIQINTAYLPTSGFRGAPYIQKSSLTPLMQALLPQMMLPPRKPGLTDARGTEAYSVAEMRNQMFSKPTPVTSVL